MTYELRSREFEHVEDAQQILDAIGSEIEPEEVLSIRETEDSDVYIEVASESEVVPS